MALPESTAEVAAIVALCAEQRVPIVPYGAGTSLEGNAAAIRGGVCVDLTRMNRVLAVDAADMDCRVQPGVTRKQLNAELRHSGLFFPIDPGADASIGGMTSTRASGTWRCVTDVCVPISRLAECLVETRRDIAQSGLIAPIVGHVGDGNFHTLILVDPDSPHEIARAAALHQRMVLRALELDGTSTGEHGIGTGKMAFLERELGDAVGVMRAIKRALDPDDLMNPGKIFAPSR